MNIINYSENDENMVVMSKDDYDIINNKIKEFGVC